MKKLYFLGMLVLFTLKVNAQKSKNFIGKIDREKVLIKLTKNSDVLEGELVPGIGISSVLVGKMDGEHVFLEHLNGAEEVVAYFIGTIEEHVFSGTWVTINGKEPVPFKLLESVVPEITTLKIEEEFQGGKLELSLPKLINYTNKDVENSFNKYIREEVNYKELINDFFKNEDSDEKVSYSIRYEPLEVSPQLISLRLSFFVYYEGAAHGNTAFHPINYSIIDGVAITAGALKEKILNSKGKLIPLLNEALRKEYGGENVDCKVGDLHDIPPPNITSEGFIFSFNSYQLGAYACGHPDVFISFEQLK